jgi:hypothetical protein
VAGLSWHTCVLYTAVFCCRYLDLVTMWCVLKGFFKRVNYGGAVAAPRRWRGGSAAPRASLHACAGRYIELPEGMSIWEFVSVYNTVRVDRLPLLLPLLL